MNRSSRFAVAFTRSTLPALPVDLDDHVRLACEGDRDAANVVARELRSRLLVEVIPVLGGRFEQDAEDVVDDVLVAMLEGRVRPKRGPGGAVQTLLRMGKSYARRHVREAHRRHSQQDDSYDVYEHDDD